MVHRTMACNLTACGIIIVMLMAVVVNNGVVGVHGDVSLSSGSETLAAKLKEKLKLDVDVDVDVRDTYSTIGHMPPTDTRYFFPHECYNATDRKCCPDYLGSACGIALGRGTCDLAVSGRNAICNGTEQPISVFWFTDWYDYACVCNGNYWGASCEMCAPGWGGDDCETALALRIRRDIDTYSDDEIATLVRGFELVYTTPHPYWPRLTMWQWQASMHHWAFRPMNQLGEPIVLDFAHLGPSLTHWHRVYQFNLERMMSIVLQDPTFTIPYWNWTKTTAGVPETDVALTITGGDGDPDSLLPWTCDELQERLDPNTDQCNCTLNKGPFVNFTTIGWWGLPVLAPDDTILPVQRALGCLVDELLTAAVIDAVMSIINYSLWYPQFEIVHGIVHSYVGWTMRLGSPASDPLFYLHHSFIDLLLDRWIRQAMEDNVYAMNNMTPDRTVRPGHAYMQCVSPMFPLMTQHAMFRPGYALGYTYDYLVATDPLVTTKVTIPERATGTTTGLPSTLSSDTSAGADVPVNSHLTAPSAAPAIVPHDKSKPLEGLQSLSSSSSSSALLTRGRSSNARSRSHGQQRLLRAFAKARAAGAAAAVIPGTTTTSTSSTPTSTSTSTLTPSAPATTAGARAKASRRAKRRSTIPQDE